MSQLIVDGNEIIPGSIEVTTTNTSITPKDNLQVVLNINQVSSTAVVGSGTDLGMRMSLINKNSNACTVIFGGEGGTVSYTLALNKTLKLVWVGTYWIGTVGGVLSGVDNAGNSFSYNTETVLHAIPQNTQYTTEEVDTGMKWVDGKPIYCLVFETTSIGVGTGTYRKTYTASIDLTDKSVDTFIKAESPMMLINVQNVVSAWYLEGSAGFSDVSSYTTQFTSTSAYNPTTKVYGITFNSIVNGGTPFITAATKARAILYYTKTTD